MENDYPPPPKVNEISLMALSGMSVRDFDYSWIEDEILAVYHCEDGVVIILRQCWKLGELVDPLTTSK